MIWSIIIFIYRLLYREHLEYDLSNDWEYLNLSLLYNRCVNPKFGEFCINITVDNINVLSPFVKGIEIPKKVFYKLY